MEVANIMQFIWASVVIYSSIWRCLFSPLQHTSSLPIFLSSWILLAHNHEVRFCLISWTRILKCSMASSSHLVPPKRYLYRPWMKIVDHFTTHSNTHLYFWLIALCCSKNCYCRLAQNRGCSNCIKGLVWQCSLSLMVRNHVRCLTILLSFVRFFFTSSN